jgi:hypothetical protein
MFNDIVNEKDYEYESSISILKNLLKCPDCGEKCYISEFTGLYFKTDCTSCNMHWKIKFYISEI